MTFLRFEDSVTGLQVIFFDYQDLGTLGSVGNEAAGCDDDDDGDNFIEAHIGVDLDRTASGAA